MPSWTRLQLFEAVLDTLGEKIGATATDAGTLSTFISSRGLVASDNALKAREVWYVSSANPAVSGDNVHTRAFVTGNSESARRITVTPDWPAIPQIGDVILLANDHGWSATVDEIHANINLIIEQYRESMASEVASDTVTFNARTGTVAVPAEWDQLLGAQWQDTNSRWHTVPHHEFDPWEDFWSTPKNVAINGVAAVQANTRPVRLIGAINLAPLAADNESTTLDLTFIRYQVAANLRRSTAIRWGDLQTAMTDSQLLQAQADQALQNVGKRFWPFGNRVMLT